MTLVGAEPEPLRVALYTGIYLRNDAISNSVRHKVEALTALKQSGAAVEWTVFTQASDYLDKFVHIVGNPTELSCDPAFWTSDVHIFEFGIAYELFNAVYLIPPEETAVAVYHNITPRHLVTDALTAAAVERSERQKHNLFRMAHVACDSEFNRADLVDMGIAPDRLSLLHLPPALHSKPRQRVAPHLRPGPLRLLFVGRMVASKGVLDLMQAMTRLVASGVEVHLTVAGNIRLSDPVVVEEMHRLVEQGLAGAVDLVGEVLDDQLADLYASADALVMPSYHEGYCVTVIEALAAGCFVIAYDAGNLPNVVGGVGALVRTGDVDGLGSAVQDLAQRFAWARRDRTPVRLPTVEGETVWPEWERKVAMHNTSFDAEQYNAAFLELLARAARATPAGVPDWLRTAQLEGIPT